MKLKTVYYVYVIIVYVRSSLQGDWVRPQTETGQSVGKTHGRESEVEGRRADFEESFNSFDCNDGTSCI